MTLWLKQFFLWDTTQRYTSCRRANKSEEDPSSTCRPAGSNRWTLPNWCGASFLSFRSRSGGHRYSLLEAIASLDIYHVDRSPQTCRDISHAIHAIHVWCEILLNGVGVVTWSQTGPLGVEWGVCRKTVGAGFRLTTFWNKFGHILGKCATRVDEVAF